MRSTLPQDILNEERWHASSWGRPYPNSNVVESHIFGGWYSLDTSESANCDDSTPEYNYNDGYEKSFSINDFVKCLAKLFPLDSLTNLLSLI